MIVDYSAIRAELAETQDDVSTSVGVPPSPADIYAPPVHSSALDPDRSLVVGGRGAGKTFWAAAYLDPDARRVMASEYPSLRLEHVNAVQGFTGEEGGLAPSPRRLGSLLEQGAEPEELWRAVILRALPVPPGEAPLGPDLENMLEHVRNVRISEFRFKAGNEVLLAGNQRIVVVFDGLDRSANNWQAVRSLIRGLMKVILDLRPYRAVRPKAFLRPDQFEDDKLFEFVDASKLKASAVRLDWRPLDLYGLFFTRLARSPISGASFAQLAKTHRAPLENHPSHDLIRLPDSLRQDADTQAKVFNAIAGPYMGSDHRRGRTYTWVPNHLADARGEVSPRSFLRALKQAAVFTPAPTRTAIDAAGIRAGVQAASQVRLDQLSEDYRWAQIALEPLADLNVPCAESDFTNRWKNSETVATILADAETERYLGPVELEARGREGEKLLLQALIRLGVVERRPDGRINIPDIYRVAAQLLRRGGVRPHRRLR